MKTIITPEYVNTDGFVTIKPGAPAFPGEGNGWLQLGLALLVDGGGGEALHARVPRMLERCRKNSVCPLIWRSPWKKNADDHETCDDYWGALLLDHEWAKQVREWGIATGGVYDIREQDSGLTYRFGRFPAFTPFLKVCAGEKLSLWDYFLVTIALLWDTLFTGSASGNMIAFCRARVFELDSGFGALLARLWYWRIKQRYGSLGASWAGYFGPDHPLSKV